MAISTIYDQTSSRYSNRHDPSSPPPPPPPPAQNSDIENGITSIPIANKTKTNWIYMDFTVAAITFPSLLIIALFIEANLNSTIELTEKDEEYDPMSILILIVIFIVISFFICGYVTYRMGLRLWAGPLEMNNSINNNNNNGDDDDDDDDDYIARPGGVYDLNSYLAHHFPPSYESCIAADKFPPPSYDSVYAYPTLYPIIVPVTVCHPQPSVVLLYAENFNGTKSENLPSDIAIGHM